MIGLGSEVLATSLLSWTDGDGNAQVLNADVVNSVTDRRHSKLTDHVVEDGSVVTDHVVLEPESVMLEFVITQTPLQGPGMSQQSLAINATGQKLETQVYPLEIPPSRFVPGGFLLLTQGARTAITAGVNAVLGAVGLGSGAGGAPSMQGKRTAPTEKSFTVQTLQADAETDRVTEAHDKLIEIRDGSLPVTISFKGRLYADYLLTEVELSQQQGEFGMGRFRVSARAFHTATATAVQLPSPADFRAKAKVAKGAKSGKVPDPDPTKGPARSLLKKAQKGVDAGVAGVVKGLMGH